MEVQKFVKLFFVRACILLALLLCLPGTARVSVYAADVQQSGTGSSSSSGTGSGSVDNQTYAAGAGSVQSLTDLFYMKAFSGSTEVLAKMNWLGGLMSAIISIFCFIGLFQLVLRIVITLMYLSGRNLFDTIHDIKSKSTGTAFGLPSLAKSTFNSEYGSGLDALVGFFLGLAPDIKTYSDYADGRVRYNLSEDDTATTYMLKISLPTIVMIFFLSIGWSGTLWQMYGTVVDAMAVAAQRFTDTRLDTIVNRALNADSYYKFGFPSTELGKFRNKLASKMYSECLRKTYQLDSMDTQNLGRNIENWVNSNITADYLASACFANSVTNVDERDAKNFNYSVVINTAKSGNTDKASNSSSNTGEWTLQAGDFGLADGTASNPLYIHVYINRKQSTSSTNYFTYKEKVNGSSSSRNDDYNGGTQGATKGRN